MFRGDYPQDWRALATAIKDEAQWRCVRCGHAHDPAAGRCLTVHHFNGDKAVCDRWNCMALCQACHLSVQGRVNPANPLMFMPATWAMPYIAGYYEAGHGVAGPPYDLNQWRAIYEAGATDQTFSALLPARDVGLILDACRKHDGDVALAFGQGKWGLKAGDARLVGTQIEDNFPPYRDVIPKDSTYTATVNVDVLLRATRQAALLTDEETRGVRFAFTSDGLTLSSRAVEMGEAEVTCSLESYKGDPLEIGFNPGYLADALKAAEADEVTLCMTASNKPARLEAGSLVAVVMPMNLSQ